MPDPDKVYGPRGSDEESEEFFPQSQGSQATEKKEAKDIRNARDLQIVIKEMRKKVTGYQIRRRNERCLISIHKTLTKNSWRN